MSTPSTTDMLRETLRRLTTAQRRVDELERARREPIAVLGMGLRLPGGVADPATFWARLRDGYDAVGPLTTPPDGRRTGPADGEPSRWSGLVDQVDGFDAGFFGISPAEAERMDPQQRLVLEVAWEAIEDAGIPADRLRSSATGVYLGIFGNDYMGMQLTGSDELNAYTGPGAAHSIAANRLSYLLDLRGPSLAVDTACSSSLVAVHLAVQGLRAGDCDFALVGGVNLILSPLSTDITGKVLPLAPGGRCRTFDAAADGIVRSEGCVMLLLARTADCAEGRYLPRAHLLGTAVNQDGRTNGLTAPSPASQRDVLARALAQSGVDAGEMSYVESHGTGTPLGDPLEVEAVRQVYDVGTRPCALGSVKANLGHLEAAAGVAGLAKTILVLEHGEVPPVPHLTRLNPEIDLGGSRLSALGGLRPLPAEVDPLERYGAVSSFGFGGTNAHVVVRGVPKAGPTPPAAGRPLILPVSARDPAALAALGVGYAALLTGAQADPALLCGAAAHWRTHHRFRRCVTAPTAQALADQLATWQPDDRQPVARSPRVAFVFNGQGSQWAGMGEQVWSLGDAARAELAACAEYVRARFGRAPATLLGAGDPEALDDTEIAQLAIASIQLAIVAQLRDWGITPDAVVGHSMGEIVAATVAGAMDRETALDLLVHRARALAACRDGAMAVIGLPEHETDRLLTGVEGVAVAAVNSALSTVVSGDAAGVARVRELAEAAGARVAAVPVRYGFHSPLLDGADDELTMAVSEFLDPSPRNRPDELAFYSTVTGARVPVRKLDAAYWGRNLRAPVRLADAMTTLAADGVDVVVEVGPRPVLLRDITEVLDGERKRTSVLATMRRDRDPGECLRTTLAGLYESGCDPDWTAIMPAPDGRVAVPTYPWQRLRYWLPDRSDGGDDTPHPASRAVTMAETLRAVSEVERLELLRRYVGDRLSALLGNDSTDLDLPLTDLGLDSTAVVELKNQAERDLRTTIPLGDLLAGVTAGELAEGLARVIGTEAVPVADAARLLSELDTLSDDEVQAALDALTQEPADD